MATWIDIAATRLDLDSRADTTLFNDYASRDEAMIETPFPLEILPTGTEVSATEGGTPGGWTQVKTWDNFYIPRNAKRLFLVIEGAVSSGTGKYRFVIGTLVSTEATATSIRPIFSEVECSFSDVSSLRGTEVTLALEVDNDTAFATTYAQERIRSMACRFLQNI